MHQTDLGWLCRIDGGQVFISRLEVEPGTSMPAEGESGTVTIAGFAAERVRKALRH